MKQQEMDHMTTKISANVWEILRLLPLFGCVPLWEKTDFLIVVEDSPDLKNGLE